MSNGPEAPILAAGDAYALLLDLPDTDREVRDAAVTAALRRAAGRADITVSRRPSGRPRLAPPLPELGVSLSRRGDLVLAGVSPTHAVGVDIEIDDPARPLDAARLAADHFSVAEAARVRSLPPERARQLFLDLWVAKEAFLKTIGRGVHDGLRDPDLASFVDALLAAEPARRIVMTLQDGAVLVCAREARGATTLHLALAVAAGPGR